MFTSALKSFQSNIASNYTISAQPSSVSGPWKIFDAKQKKTGKLASVFVFDKKSLDPNTTGGLGGRTNESSLKRAREEVIERLKKEASSLARLRHPSILELTEPVEDTRSGGLTFATEPVTASLAGLLQEKDDQERSGGAAGRSSRYVIEDADGTKRRRELEIDELEIQKGLLQLGKGLEFLHESASLVHGNLNPDAIFINAKGDWKISGLGFSGRPEGASNSSVAPIALSEVLNYDARLPRSVQLNLDYTSPDFVMDTNVTTAADMFSLGVLIIALYNSPHQSPIESNGSISSYKRTFSSSSSVPSQTNNFLSARPVPKELASGVLPRLITRRPAQRLSAREFQQAQYFDNVLVSTIRFLDSLPAKTPNEKSQFMRGLPRILNQFPKSVLEKKVLPALLEETKDKELLSLVLQNVFKIITTMPSGKRPFTEKVIPKLRETFLTGGNTKGAAQERDTSKEAGLMVVLENMGAIGENCTGKEFKDDILPIILIALESPTHAVVDASMRTLPACLATLDFSTIKNELFPVIAAVFSKTSSMGIKIRGLQALRTLCGGGIEQEEPDTGDGLDGIMSTSQSKSKAKTPNSVVLDKYTIQEKVVPLLRAIKTKEPAVMTAALDVFTEIGKIADSDFLALEVLPILWNFSLGPLLNLQQFQAYMTQIKSLSTRIESEHTKKLQELSASNTAAATRSSEFLSFNNAGLNNGIDSNGNSEDADFESLVTGRKAATSSPNPLDDPWATTSVPTVRSPPQPTPTAVPTFSWSTPQPSPPPMGAPRANLAPLQPTPISRTVTPDQSLSSFAALTPSASGLASNSNTYSMPLQPARPGMGSMASAPTSQSVNWSAASGATAGWAPMGTPSATNFGQPSVPAYSQPTNTGAFGIPPPLQSSYPSFSIAPPPMSPQRQVSGNTMNSLSSLAGGGGLAGGNAMGNQQGQKKGLDQYESLL